MSLRWKNSFSCHIKEIDEQHKRLFEIGAKLNILEPICSMMDCGEEVKEVIHELKEYAYFHFEYEESLLLQHEIPKFKEHREQHRFFIQEVYKMEQQDNDFNNPAVMRAMISFINTWISEHILKIDMLYSEIITKRGVQ